MYTLRSIVRSVVVCRPYVSPGNPITPCGVRRLAAVVKKHFASAAMQLAVACISSVVTGSTGIEESAVSRAADDSGVGVTNASASHVAEIATSASASRLITEMLPSVRES
jgi:hypothetical protein